MIYDIGVFAGIWPETSHPEHKSRDKTSFQSGTNAASSILPGSVDQAHRQLAESDHAEGNDDLRLLMEGDSGGDT